MCKHKHPGWTLRLLLHIFIFSLSQILFLVVQFGFILYIFNSITATQFHLLPLHRHDLSVYSSICPSSKPSMIHIFSHLLPSINPSASRLKWFQPPILPHWINFPSVGWLSLKQCFNHRLSSRLWTSLWSAASTLREAFLSCFRQVRCLSKVCFLWTLTGSKCHTGWTPRTVVSQSRLWASSSPGLQQLIILRGCLEAADSRDDTRLWCVSLAELVPGNSVNEVCRLSPLLLCVAHGKQFPPSQPHGHNGQTCLVVWGRTIAYLGDKMKAGLQRH